MSSTLVLLAHERPVIREAIARVLDDAGFEVEMASDGASARSALEAKAFAALVCDVGLPVIPGYELCGLAKNLRGGGARVVILVASVFRRTAYKRRPRQLYGADDYVELHHIGDQLVTKLRHHLRLQVEDGERRGPAEVAEVEATLEREGDQRLDDRDARRVADLIVADMVLYAGAELARAPSVEVAEQVAAEDLETARHLFETVYRCDAIGAGKTDDLVLVAFRDLMGALIRSPGGGAGGAKRS